jgi:protein SCO1/2
MKRIVFILVVLIICVAISYTMLRKNDQKPLPIINPTDLKKELVDPELLAVGQGHTIGNFSFTNQDGITITEKEIENKVFVAEYFFSTCKSICPIMNQQMQRIQKTYKGNKSVKILSFTVDPETDNSETLKTYAVQHGYQKGQWHFLTGTKSSLYSLARKSFFVLKPAEATNLGDAGNDFIHTNNFVLVDKKKRIRGYYDGTNPAEITELIEDIELLLNE